ncbi:MAG TPA: cell envelope integrity protein TolA [Rhabdaerophilum sp.]|nr:cell envelope integrity protein TolA [Rhabdaerophilum sp.]
MALALRDHLGRFLSWRQPGGMVSAGAHALLLVAGVYAFNSAQPFSPANEALPVEVVSDQAFSEMMKGDKNAKEKAAVPERRVDRVAETKEDKDKGVAKTDTPTPPVKQEEAQAEKPEPEQKVAIATPPVRPPELRIAPPEPKLPAQIEEDDKIDEQAELLRKKREEEKKIEEQKKLEEAARAEAKRKLEEKRLEEKRKEEARIREEKRKLEETLKAEVEAERKAEEIRKAEEKKKAEAAKKAAEAKAKRDQEKREAEEQKKLNDAIRQKLLASRDTPSSTGSTGAAISNRSTLGTTTATGAKLSPSDRAQLIGILTEQMSRCISYSGTAPKTGPQLTFTLAQGGTIVGGVNLVNRSGESNFVPFAEATMRALRNCQPYRVPARFLATYEDWKNIRLNIDTSEMQ